ncbi:hypothetical protein CELD12_32350 [Cellulomonas sp. NTE-D12]|nr:hypothetical protein CELD12_32350 [Cellulomonas sp. NTE-D12]
MAIASRLKSTAGATANVSTIAHTIVVTPVLLDPVRLGDDTYGRTPGHHLKRKSPL